MDRAEIILAGEGPIGEAGPELSTKDRRDQIRFHSKTHVQPAPLLLLCTPWIGKACRLKGKPVTRSLAKGQQADSGREARVQHAPPLGGDSRGPGPAAYTFTKRTNK